MKTSIPLLIPLFSNPVLLLGSGIPLHWGIEYPQDQGPLLPLMPTYVAGAMGPSMCTL